MPQYTEQVNCEIKYFSIKNENVVITARKNEVCKGYVFTPVCQSFCSQGERSASVHADTPPGEDTLPGVDPPRADTPQKQNYPPCAVHAGRYGQQVSGTHPTGMHTCMKLIFLMYNVMLNGMITYL